MTNINKELIIEKINNTFELCDLDINYILDHNDIEEEQDLIDAILEHIQEQDIVYYNNAISYLAKHDAGLNQSLELANNYGFSIDRLNSEVLATLLYQYNLQEELSDIDFSDCFDDE